MHDPLATDAERSTARWIHLGTLIAAVITIVSQGVVFFVPLLVAVIVWQTTKGESPFVDDHGREATNFQLSLIILSVILIVGAVFTCGLSAILLVPLQVVNIVALILASMQALRGNYYRYPVCLRMIKPAGA